LEKTMNGRTLNAAAIVPAIVFALAMGGCDRTSDVPPANTSSAAPATNNPPSTAPDASAVAQAPSTAGPASDTANGNDEPMKTMTKAQENTSMPMPGQVNDHSTLAGDPKKP
jgi:hypothetical protein